MSSVLSRGGTGAPASLSGGAVFQVRGFDHLDLLAKRDHGFEGIASQRCAGLPALAPKFSEPIDGGEIRRLELETVETGKTAEE